MLIFANDTFSNFHNARFLKGEREGVCVLGQKIPAPVMSSFGRCRFLGFLITTWIVFVGDPEFLCHWLTQSNHNKKVLLGRHFGRCLDGRFLHSPKDENAHTEFFVLTKNWVSNQVQIENHWLVIKVWNGVLDRLLLYSQIYSWARA